MQEAVINFGRIAYGALGLWNRVPDRNGNQSVLGTSAPSEVYPCKGGGPNDYCYIYCTRAGSHHWERLLNAIGREDLLDDPRFQTPRDRWEHRDEVDAVISEGDVMVENFAPGVIERLGFGYEDVRKINPRIIYAQVKGCASDRVAPST